MSAPFRAIAAPLEHAHAWQPADGQGALVPIGGGGGSALGAAGAVPQGTVLTRTLYVNIAGSLGALEMAGPSAGSWKLVDGRSIGVFGVGSEVDAQVCYPLPSPPISGAVTRFWPVGGA
jgi:hypothetical protein